MNSFWDNVAQELEYLGMTNKSLAEKVGITASNVGKGIKQGSVPSAETAVKIAKILDVSVEYLVTGSLGSDRKSLSAENNAQLHLYRKYKSLIEICENLTPEEVRLLEQVAENFKK